MKSAVLLMLLPALTALPAAAQQHDMAAMSDTSDGRGLQWHWGAHAVGLATRVAPAFADRTLTEAYLTQPTLMGGVATAGGGLSFMTSISLEGLTLDRGELGPGTHGEGYIDRRHPHTYLHEAMLVAQGSAGPVDVSLSAGRGFAPFGTDDPMMRPIVRFPVNHHLSQVLERLVTIAGVRAGPVALEVAAFNGNEPLDAEDLGDPDRFGDSWSARVTIRPRPRWELQASRAWLNSPEEPTGEGDDSRKLSASIRHDGMIGSSHVYGLVEWARSTHVIKESFDDISNSSLLAEASLARSGWKGALRLERTDRIEEGRIDPFRTSWPPIDHLVIGITKWHVASLHAERAFAVGGFRIAPFAAVSGARVTSDEGFLFDPNEFYGSNNIWSLSAGFRLDAGMVHERMGRYGVALQGGTPAMTHH